MELRQDSFQDLRRRAELFSYIADLVRTEGGDIPVETSPDVRLTLLPKIEIAGEGVVCNGARLDLSRRSMSLKLFSLFCDRDDLKLSRPDLVMGIYDLDPQLDHSERYLDSLYVNIVKLVSRTRILAAAHLSQGAGRGIDWFGYDAETRLWSLYRLRREYLGHRK